MADTLDELIDQLDLKPVSAGLLLAVQAQPGSRRNAITGIHQGRLKIGVTQVAERGKANQALLDVLTTSLGLRKSQVEWASGLRSAKKQLLIQGLSVDELRQRIRRCLVMNSTSAE
jgi:uncharacterized protein (TIGR00251 family)